MRLRTAIVSATVGLGVAATLGVAPSAGAATPTSQPTVAHYTGKGESAANNQAFLDAVMKKVAEKRAVHPNAAVTVTYEVDAPSFASQIASSTSIWNSSVSNVHLQKVSSGGDFYYTEGSDPSIGSYASTDGHGSGYIFIDYGQAQVYNSTRIVAHETGHVLGLPDHYSGPCSELMSGGGPGPSCQNTHPDSTEIARVNTLWANGFAQLAQQLR